MCVLGSKIPCQLAIMPSCNKYSMLSDSNLLHSYLFWHKVAQQVHFILCLLRILNEFWFAFSDEESLDEIRFAAYRTAAKLLFIQNRTNCKYIVNKRYLGSVHTLCLGMILSGALMWKHIFLCTHVKIRAWCTCPSTRSRLMLGCSKGKKRLGNHRKMAKKCAKKTGEIEKTSLNFFC